MKKTNEVPNYCNEALDFVHSHFTAISGALNLIKHRPTYQENYLYVLVFDFQRSNFFHASVCATGDSKQPLALDL